MIRVKKENIFVTFDNLQEQICRQQKKPKTVIRKASIHLVCCNVLEVKSPNASESKAWVGRSSY